MGSKFAAPEKIKTAVVTGRHPFDVPSFHALFRSMREVDFYPQSLEDFVADAGKVRQFYDVVVFYNFHREPPAETEEKWGKAAREALEEVPTSARGILVLHHALLAFPEWRFWSDLVGIPDRSFGFHMNQTVVVEIADPDHPVTRGLSPWTMIDETYTMAEPQAGCHVVLTTYHLNSMKALAWTRSVGRARVFCLQSGHGHEAYSNRNFRLVVERAIQWLAGRL